MAYILHVAVLVEIYLIAVVALDLIAGHAGIVSVANAALFGIGAYTSALLALAFGVPFPLCLLASAGVAGLCSVVISIPSMRLYDDYFVMATFACQMVVFTLLNNWVGVTRGPMGIHGIPAARLAGLSFETSGRFVVMAGILAAITWSLVTYITRGPFGHVLHAIREDEVFARALGKNTFAYKITAFAISACFTGVAGALYAFYASYIDPRSFAATESIALMSMVVIGGAGSRWGALIGTITIIVLPEILRFAGFPAALAANLKQIVYGSLLVAMMRFRPRGLVGKYDFAKR